MRAPELQTLRSWPEQLFHVLAHVAGTAHLPASVYDAEYVRFVERHAGPAGGRALAEDADVLARALPTHELLARAQLLAWLFDDVDEASECATTDLDALAAEQVRRPELLPELRRVGVAVEVLRCAAELERDVMASLPPVVVEDKELTEALRVAWPAAPTLAHYRVLPVRALRLRGRLFGDEIWIGAPSRDTALSAQHVAWQACHEASVGEVFGQARAGELGERAVEQVAVVLLAERAREAGLRQAHAAWLSHLGPTIETAPASLDAAGRELLATCLSSGG